MNPMNDSIQIGDDGLPEGPKAVEMFPDGTRIEHFWDGSKLINIGCIIEARASYPLMDGDTPCPPESLCGW